MSGDRTYTHTRMHSALQWMQSASVHWYWLEPHTIILGSDAPVISSIPRRGVSWRRRWALLAPAEGLEPLGSKSSGRCWRSLHSIAGECHSYVAVSSQLAFTVCGCILKALPQPLFVSTLWIVLWTSWTPSLKYMVLNISYLDLFL